VLRKDKHFLTMITDTMSYRKIIKIYHSIPENRINCSGGYIQLEIVDIVLLKII